MYPVSKAFLQAVQENTRRYYWTGKITTTKGSTYEFGADDIVIPVYLGGTMLDEVIVNAQQRANLRSGGR